MNPGAYGNGCNWLRRAGVTVSYGSTVTNTMKLVFTGSRWIELFNWKTHGAVSSSVRGQRYKVATDTDADNPDPRTFTMQFRYPDGVTPWPLSKLGVAVSRYGVSEVQATVVYSDASQATSTAALTAAWTLFYFEAPAGKTIAAVTFLSTVYTGRGIIVFDDIGFIGSQQ